MGVDAEVGSSTIEERFALLPRRTGSYEGCAEFVDVALGQGACTELALSVYQLVEQG